MGQLGRNIERRRLRIACEVSVLGPALGPADSPAISRSWPLCQARSLRRDNVRGTPSPAVRGAAECCMQHVARVACNTSCNTPRRVDALPRVSDRVGKAASGLTIRAHVGASVPTTAVGKRVAL